MNSRGYKSEKRRKELAQQKKQEEKRLRRLNKKVQGAPEGEIDADGNVVVKAPPDETGAVTDAEGSSEAPDAADGASTDPLIDASPDATAPGTEPAGTDGKSGQA